MSNENRSTINVMVRLLELLKPLILILSVAVIAGVLGYLAAMFIPILGSYGIINAIGLASNIKLSTLLAFLGVIGFSRGILHYIEQISNHFLAFKILAIIRDRVFSSLRKLAPAKLESKNKGDLISIITGDIELLEVFYAHTISPILIAIIVSITMILFIGRLHFVLGIIALFAYLTVGVLIPTVASKRNKENGEKLRKNMGNMNTFMLDSLRGIKEIIQYDAGNSMVRKLNNKGEKLVEDQKRMSKNRGINMAVTGFAISVFSIAILFTSLYLFNINLLDENAVLISTVSMFSSFGPVIAIANLGSSLTQTIAAGNRVLDIIDESKEVIEVKDKMDIDFSGASTKDLSFKYEGDKYILEGINLNVEENEIIGIVGKSGSGKSTLLKLFMRFWDVDKGEVKLNPLNIKEINTARLRDMESFMTQDTDLFHDSIINNIKVAKLDASLEEVKKACKMASLDEFISDLPKGYNTEVGELGDTLSGGEKQRIGLARTFLHNAPFLLLDEPTSNIDSLNEAIILKAIREDKKRTTIIVSHKESTMRIADRVINIESGRMS